MKSPKPNTKSNEKSKAQDKVQLKSPKPKTKSNEKSKAQGKDQVKVQVQNPKQSPMPKTKSNDPMKRPKPKTKTRSRRKTVENPETTMSESQGPRQRQRDSRNNDRMSHAEMPRNAMKTTETSLLCWNNFLKQFEFQFGLETIWNLFKPFETTFWNHLKPFEFHYFAWFGCSNVDATVNLYRSKPVSIMFERLNIFLKKLLILQCSYGGQKTMNLNPNSLVGKFSLKF